MKRRYNKRKQNQKVKVEEVKQEQSKQDQEQETLKEKQNQQKQWNVFKSAKTPAKDSERSLDDARRELLNEHLQLIQRLKNLQMEQQHFAVSERFTRQTTKHFVNQGSPQNSVKTAQNKVVGEVQQQTQEQKLSTKYLDQNEGQNKVNSLISQVKFQSQTFKNVASGYQIQDRLPEYQNNIQEKCKDKLIDQVDHDDRPTQEEPAKKRYRSSQDNLQTSLMQCFDTFKVQFVHQLLDISRNKGFQKVKKTKKLQKKVMARSQGVQCKLSLETKNQQVPVVANPLQKENQTQTSNSFTLFGNTNLEPSNANHLMQKQIGLDSKGVVMDSQLHSESSDKLRLPSPMDIDQQQSSTESLGGGALLHTPSVSIQSMMGQGKLPQPNSNQKSQSELQREDSVNNSQSNLKSAARNKISRYLNTLDNISEEDQSPTQSLQYSHQKLGDVIQQQMEASKRDGQEYESKENGDSQKMDFEFRTPKAADYDIAKDVKFKLFQKFQGHDNSQLKLGRENRKEVPLNNTIHQSLDVQSENKEPGDAKGTKYTSAQLPATQKALDDEKSKRDLQIQINNNASINLVTPTTQTSRSALDYNCDLLTVDYKRSTEFSAWANNYDYLLEDIRYLFDEEQEGDDPTNYQYVFSSQKNVSPKRLEFHQKPPKNLFKSSSKMQIAYQSADEQGQIFNEGNLLNSAKNDNQLMQPNQEELTMQDIEKIKSKDQQIHNNNLKILHQSSTQQEGLQKLEDLKNSGFVNKGDFDKMKTLWHTVENFDQAMQEDGELMSAKGSQNDMSYMTCNDQSDLQSFEGFKEDQSMDFNKSTQIDTQKEDIAQDKQQVQEIRKKQRQDHQKEDIKTEDNIQPILLKEEQNLTLNKPQTEAPLTQLTKKQLEYQQQLQSLKSKPNQNKLQAQPSQEVKWETKLEDDLLSNQITQKPLATQPSEKPNLITQPQPPASQDHDWSHLTSNKFFKEHPLTQEPSKTQATPQTGKKYFQGQAQGLNKFRPQGFLQLTEEDKQLNKSTLKKRPVKEMEKEAKYNNQPALQKQKVGPTSGVGQDPPSSAVKQSRMQKIITNVQSFMQPQPQPESYLAKQNQNRPKVKALEVAKQVKLKEQQKIEEKKVQLNQKKQAQQQQLQQQNQQQQSQQLTQPQPKQPFNLQHYQNKYLKNTNNQQPNQIPNQQQGQPAKKQFFFKAQNNQPEKPANITQTLNSGQQNNLGNGTNGLLKSTSNANLLQNQNLNQQSQKPHMANDTNNKTHNQLTSAMKTNAKWKPVFSKTAEDKENIPQNTIKIITQQPQPQPQSQGQQQQSKAIREPQNITELTKVYQSLQEEIHGATPPKQMVTPLMQSSKANVQGDVLQPNNNIQNQGQEGFKQIQQKNGLMVNVQESGNFSKITKQSMTTQYEISPFRDSDDENEEEYEKNQQLRQQKKVPKWADMENVRQQLAIQSQTYDPDQIFYNPGPYTIDLSQIFGKSEKDWKYSHNDPREFNLALAQYTRRTSSGDWGIDKVTSTEQLMFRLHQGFH